MTSPKLLYNEIVGILVSGDPVVDVSFVGIAKPTDHGGGTAITQVLSASLVALRKVASDSKLQLDFDVEDQGKTEFNTLWRTLLRASRNVGY